MPPITYAFNTKLEKWFIWEGLDFSRGLSLGPETMWGVGSVEGNPNLKEVNKPIGDYKSVPRTYTNLDFSDAGKPIEAFYKTNWETLGEPAIPKKFLRAKIYSLDTEERRFESPNFTLDIETEKDYNRDKPISKSNLRFYELNEGEDGPKTPVKSRRTRLASTIARSLRFIFRNNTNNENVLISGIELEVSTPYTRGMKGKR